MSDIRIHLLGASGSGTSTLAAALEKHLQCRYFDVDHFFWLPTTPPFQTVRPRQERQTSLGESLASCTSWTLSGSLCGWGDMFIPQFDLVVFLWLPPENRMARLRAREVGRYGPAALAPGGSLYQTHQDFMQWAAKYDTAGPEMRSRQLHEDWLAELPCPVMRLEGEMTTEAQVSAVLQHIQHRRESVTKRPETNAP